MAVFLCNKPLLATQQFDFNPPSHPLPQINETGKVGLKNLRASRVCVAQNETAVSVASTGLTVFAFTANGCLNFLRKRGDPRAHWRSSRVRRNGN